MALEAGDGFISGLVATNPVNATDQVAQGDDHIRLIKTALLGTFPNLTGAVTPTQTELNYLDGVTGVSGTGNLVLSASPTLTGTAIAAAITASGLVKSTASIGFEVESTGPNILLDETDASANERQWRLRSGAGAFTITTYDDSSVQGTHAILIDRNGTTVTEIELNATAFDFNGTLDVSGASTFGGNFTVPSGWSVTTGGGTLSLLGTGETLATFADDGAVTLYYDNSAKLDTKTDGVNIVGELEADSLDIDGNIDVSGTLTTPNSSASEVGFKGLPQNNQFGGGNYTAVLTDANKHILMGGNTFTIPANASVAFPTGTTLTIANSAGFGATTIAITSDSMRLAGTSSTGSRTLAENGLATAIKLDSTTWFISGTGLS